MTPQISEFSYGFALTNELVALADVQAAPIFPSLVAEGMPGGGFDVQLDTPGLPIFLQFKRSDYMSRRSAREFKLHGVPSVPYYRFAVTERRLSRQHELLLELNRTNPHVYYAAPQFYTLEEINASWLAGRVAADSVFVRPSDIGTLDDAPHHVAFRGQDIWVFSEPKKLPFRDISSIVTEIRADLAKESRPLSTIAAERLAETRDAIERVRVRRARERRADHDERPRYLQSDLLMIGAGDQTPTPAPRLRPRKGLPEMVDLAELADVATRNFNAQLVVFQDE